MIHPVLLMFEIYAKALGRLKSIEEAEQMTNDYGFIYNPNEPNVLECKDKMINE